MRKSRIKHIKAIQGFLDSNLGQPPRIANLVVRYEDMDDMSRLDYLERNILRAIEVYGLKCERDGCISSDRDSFSVEENIAFYEDFINLDNENY